MPENCKCTKEKDLERLEKNDNEIYDIIHGKNLPPGILQQLSEFAECIPEFKDQLKILTDDKITRDAIKNNFWENLKIVSVYCAIFFGLSTFYFATKEKPITIDQIQTVVNKSLLKYNITDDEIILRGRSIKPEGMTKEKEQRGIKEMNK